LERRTTDILSGRKVIFQFHGVLQVNLIMLFRDHNNKLGKPSIYNTRVIKFNVFGSLKLTGFKKVTVSECYQRKASWQITESIKDLALVFLCQVL